MAKVTSQDAATSSGEGLYLQKQKKKKKTLALKHTLKFNGLVLLLMCPFKCKYYPEMHNYLIIVLM